MISCEIVTTVFCVHLLIDQPQIRASGVVLQGSRHEPSITYKITSCWVTLLQQTRRAVVLGQPSSLRPHWRYYACSPTPFYVSRLLKPIFEDDGNGYSSTWDICFMTCMFYASLAQIDSICFKTALFSYLLKRGTQQAELQSLFFVKVIFKVGRLIFIWSVSFTLCRTYSHSDKSIKDVFSPRNLHCYCSLLI